MDPVEDDEVIPTRDSRSVAAMARSGRVLRTLKQSTDDGMNRPEHRETVSWIPEEKMKIWQIDLYHRVTEDGGVNVIKRSSSEGKGKKALIKAFAIAEEVFVFFGTIL